MVSMPQATLLALAKVPVQVGIPDKNLILNGTVVGTDIHQGKPFMVLSVDDKYVPIMLDNSGND